ncbi:DNA binding protein [Formosa sp. Hel1_33_131]|jgi:tRNA(fMet)-specific endonuclease VapC|nr:DNA binding protein [Formosa sp. Hel1_33_131]
MKGLYNLDEKIKKAGIENCYISEITLAELKFGVENSEQKKKNKEVLDNFINGIKIVPIYNSLDFYAIEKARLRKNGNTVDDFDLLIGASAVSNNMTLVTNNIKHFKNIKNIEIQDWTQ